MTIPISVTRVDKRAALTSFHEKLTGNFGYAEILFTTQILEDRILTKSGPEKKNYE